MEPEGGKDSRLAFYHCTPPCWKAHGQRDTIGVAMSVVPIKRLNFYIISRPKLASDRFSLRVMQWVFEKMLSVLADFELRYSSSTQKIKISPTPVFTDWQLSLGFFFYFPPTMIPKSKAHLCMNFSWTYPKQRLKIFSIMLTQDSSPCDNVESAMWSKT